MLEFSITRFSSQDRDLFSPTELRQLMWMEFERARMFGYPLIFMVISVDRLEHLQDLYGWESKEEILGTTLRSLRSITRAGDLFGRLADDRVLAAFPHTPPASAARLAARLLAKIHRQPFDADGRMVRVTLSVGSAHEGQTRARDMESMIWLAERAQEEARRRGGDRYLASEEIERTLFAPEVLAEQRAAAAAVAAQAQAVVEAPPASAPPQRRPEVPHVPSQVISPFPQAADSDSEPTDREELEEALRLTREESRRALNEQAQAHRQEVDMLERRLSKLSKVLEQTESALARIAKMKDVDPGIASIYRVVQGINEDDGYAEQKRSLMSKIFEANLEMRKEIQAGT